MSNEVGPRTLRRMIDDSVVRWQIKQLSKHEELEPVCFGEGPTMQGLKKAMKHLAAKNEHGPAAALRSTVVGAQWPEARLHAARLSESDRCLKCKEARRTLVHRHAECPKVLKGTPVPPRMKQVAAKLGGNTGLPELLLGRGLVPKPRGRPEEHSKDRVFFRHPENADSMFEGVVFTDGSRLHPTDKRMRRTGFSIVKLSGDKLKMAMYGPCPHVQEVGAAEIVTAVMALRHSCGKIEIRSDYQGLVDGFGKGREFTTSFKHSYNEVWVEFWRAIEDVGIDNVSIVKVQAHVDPAKVPKNTLAWTNAFGNDLADKWAGAGALKHPGTDVADALARRRKAAENTAFKVGVWIAGRAAQANEEPRDCSGKRMDRRPKKARSSSWR